MTVDPALQFIVLQRIEKVKTQKQTGNRSGTRKKIIEND